MQTSSELSVFPLKKEGHDAKRCGQSAQRDSKRQTDRDRGRERQRQRERETEGEGERDRGSCGLRVNPNVTTLITT